MRLESQRPLSVSITGIDGAGKSTTTDTVAEDIGRQERVVKLFRPAYSIIEGRRELHFQRLIGLIDALHTRADASQDRRMVLTANAIHVVMQGRVIEPILTEKLRPTIILGARDFHIDPAVYAIFYSPALQRKPIEKRLKRMRVITGQEYRNIIFFLTVSPEEAVNRIEKRIEIEREALTPVERKKWRHMHEHPQQLERLQGEYRTAFDAMERSSPSTRIIEINTMLYSQAEVSKQIGDYLKSILTDKVEQK